MGDMIKMVVVLTVLAAFSGGLLAAVRDNTYEKIQIQQLTFVKGPALKAIFEDAANDPIQDRFVLKHGDEEKVVFVGVYGGEPKAVAMEAYGKGYGGDVGLMVGIDLTTDKILGVAVTTHSETPGLGSKAKDEAGLSSQFVGMGFDRPIRVTQDGGSINAISGATITSRAVAAAANQVAELYQTIKPELETNAKQIAK
jgi:Na+-translocating ferredoxin:NAD+ oxidoreductase subunit G